MAVAEDSGHVMRSEASLRGGAERKLISHGCEIDASVSARARAGRADPAAPFDAAIRASTVPMRSASAMADSEV